MKIMIDATSLARTITGIENYTKNLIMNLCDLDKKDHELILLFRNDIPAYITGKGFKPLISPFKSQLLTEQIWIPYIVNAYKPDIIHFPAFPPPLLVKRNVYFTIHDATMWKHPDTLSLKNKLYMKPLSTRGIHIAKRLITVSNSSKREILDVFPNAIDKIENLGISISDTFQVVTNKQQLESTRQKYNLPAKFFLTVGSLEPRKNILFLINAFIKFKKNKKTDFKLVISGRSAWGSTEIRDLIKRNNLQEEIILTGYLGDEELLSLYNLATYFVFPSKYEGFGLPVLEAMACGTPVIVSNSSSLPEVAGDAAIYIDPFDENSMIEAMGQAVSDDSLHADLRSKGLQRAELFLWRKVAKNVFEEYKKILG